MLCFPGNPVEEPRGGKPLCHIATYPFSCMIPSCFPLFPALHSAHSLNYLRLSPFPTSKFWRHRKLIYLIYSSWKHRVSLTHNSNFHTRHVLLINALGSPDSKVLNFLNFFPPPFLNWEIASGPTRTWKALLQEHPNLLPLWITYPAAKKSQREWLLLKWLMANKIQLYLLGSLLNCRARWLRDFICAPPAIPALGQAQLHLGHRSHKTLRANPTLLHGREGATSWPCVSIFQDVGLNS